MLNQDKVVSLKNLVGYYPTISLNSIHSRVRVNFGREPFLFNFELFVQNELAFMLKQVETIKVDKTEVGKMVQEYVYHYGYSKTYRDVTTGLGLVPRAISSVKKSTPQVPVGEEKKEDFDININTFKTPKLTYSKSGNTAVVETTQDDSSVRTSDDNQFAQRALIRGLIFDGKFQEAERVLCLSFPSVAINPDIRTLFKVQRFLGLLRKDPLEAALFAKGHFTAETRASHFLYLDSNHTLQVGTVKDLTVLFIGKPSGSFAKILDKCQIDLSADIINMLIHSRLN